MSGRARNTAVLDACVLYPVSVADALMSIAAAGLYAAKWTTAIEGEWIRNLEMRRPDLVGKLDRRRDLMRAAIVDWEVPEDAWRALEPAMALPDPKDAHVLAAAIAGHADCIVTLNLRDFPEEVLSNHDLIAIHPDAFLKALFDQDPIKALAAFKDMRARSKSPPLAPEEFAHAFERNGMFVIAQRLRDAADLV